MNISGLYCERCSSERKEIGGCWVGSRQKESRGGKEGEAAEAQAGHGQTIQMLNMQYYRMHYYEYENKPFNDPSFLRNNDVSKSTLMSFHTKLNTWIFQEKIITEAMYYTNQYRSFTWW